ncbi:glycosyltransferase family 4 protein [Thalassolituus oleivorans]|uniref:glycosyltransferase family 4 protein n=1 Tax=Thalassolituus oleivorans TaxID=187493 RepID=UPI002408F34A|nr:glycosyltransferase family 4 protein [Thalassolituus oleivorans]MDF1641266.1 glycosyltransferase family 4 protein [Thalassolituus oleivorans]
MKIIYFHQYFNTPEMAGGTRSYEVAKRLVAAGHEVHMITSIRETASSNGEWHNTKEAGISVHWYPVPYSNNMNYTRRILAFFQFAVAAWRYASQIDGDLVFATSTPLTIAIPAVLVSRKKKIPMVFEVRDLWPELPIAMGALKNPVLRMMARLLEKWAYKHSEAIVALSPGMKKGIVETGYKSERVAVIPNSSDNEDFAVDASQIDKFRLERSYIRPTEPMLIYAGTFGKINGVSYMVRLAKEFAKIGSNIQILLIGDGLEKELVVTEAKSSGVLGRNLFIEDSIPKSQIPFLFGCASMASTLFIDLPEMRANSANKFFDTLASGTPVMINFGGWMHDLVVKYECGISVWNMSIEDAAYKLHRSLNDKGWLSASGANAKYLAVHQFDRGELAGQIEQVMELVLNNQADRVSTIADGQY